MDRKIVLLCIIIAALAFFYMCTRKSKSCANCGNKSCTGANCAKNSDTNAKPWTVYGSTGCGWTVKQLEHMENNGISHVFHDCDKIDCGDIKSFPTLKSPDGIVSTGFSSI
mgnify:CR=1 FL=1